MPPTPTPIPTVNPSFYSGQIIVGSSVVPDGIEVFAKINDYISEIVKTSEGRFTISINPKTIRGDIQFAALEIVAKPFAAINEIKLPNINTIIIQVNPLGKVSVSFGIFILNLFSLLKLLLG
mgnify:CR=1 FL=1